MIDRKEVIRYLGYPKSTPTQDVLDLIEVCVKEVEAVAEPKHIMRRFFAEVTDSSVKAGGLTLQSKALARHVRGCEEVIFLAATLGIGVDRLLHKYLKLQVSKAVVVQAVAATAMEDYCNRCQDEITAEVTKEGLQARPRFSPGYGDWSLAIQHDFLQILQAQKTVGIVLTEGNMMLPEKSVTAVIGLSKEQTDCHREGCEMCPNTGCAYRRVEQRMSNVTGT